MCPGWDSATSNLSNGKFSQPAARKLAFRFAQTRLLLRASRPSVSQAVGLLPVSKFISFICAQGGTRTHKPCGNGF